MSDEKQLRRHVLRMRVNDTELEFFTERAKLCGLPLSRFIREAARGDAPRARPFETNLEAVHQLARIGNNLNQLARHANATRRAKLSRRLEETLRRVDEAIERLS